MKVIVSAVRNRQVCASCVSSHSPKYKTKICKNKSFIYNQSSFIVQYLNWKAFGFSDSNVSIVWQYVTNFFV